MNSVNLVGRLTREPDIRWTQGQDQKCTARYTLAVDRGKNAAGEHVADFISCVAFGKNAEFAEKWLMKGMRIGITGSIRTGSYTNRDGQKIYTTDIVVNTQEFCERKDDSANVKENGTVSAATEESEDFIRIPDDVDEAGLPFN